MYIFPSFQLFRSVCLPLWCVSTPPFRSLLPFMTCYHSFWYFVLLSFISCVIFSDVSIFLHPARASLNLFPENFDSSICLSTSSLRCNTLAFRWLLAYCRLKSSIPFVTFALRFNSSISCVTFYCRRFSCIPFVTSSWNSFLSNVSFATILLSFQVFHSVRYLLLSSQVCFILFI